MKRTCFVLATLAAIALVSIACSSPPTPVPPTVAPTLAPTQPPAPTAIPPTTAPTKAPTATTAPTVAATTAPAGPSAAAVEKLVNDKFNNVDTNLALWNIQPGLGTVMLEYSNRLARMWFAANAGNWDMAKYQLDEMTEIQEVGETTRPKRAPMLKAFEDSVLSKLDKAISAKDKAAFTSAFNDATAGCSGCHAASSGDPWKSYQFVKIQVPKTDPAADVDWKGGGQDNFVENAPAAASATPKATLSGSLDAAGVEKLVNDKFNNVDTSLALWNIQPGLGTVMMEYANRFERLYYAAKAGNWDMAKYQVAEMTEIQEVGETTRPTRAPMLKAFEDNFLAALDKAIDAKDSKAFDGAYTNAISGCNGCHTASKSSDWKSYRFIKIQAPTADNNDYIVWKADKSTGNAIENPQEAATATPKPALTGTLDQKGVEKLVNDKFNNVDTSLALWNIQPGLGTVMIEYARRLAQVKYAVDAGNWDMAKYQVDEMTEIQEVAETTRPNRAPMLKAFEDNFLTALDKAIDTKDKDKATAALKNAITGCNGCHAASKSGEFSSYAFVQIQPPQSDPADYVQWNAGAGNTGNYSPAPASAQPTSPTTQATGPLPKGDPTAGKATFTKLCDGCHPAGAKGIGPALSGADFDKQFPTDDVLAKFIRTGEDGMPAWGPDRLSDQQLADVIAFIRTLK